MAQLPLLATRSWATQPRVVVFRPVQSRSSFCIPHPGRGLGRKELRQLLREGEGEPLLDAIEEALWVGVEALRQTAASGGAELSAKFAVDADYELQYGKLEVFYSGLEGLLGPPSMHVLHGMEREHCTGPDADAVFCTSNGMRTTSRDEFEFVVRPQPGKEYPERADIIGHPELCRQPHPPESFLSVLHLKNAQLEAEGHPVLMKEEQIAGRLYTGPSGRLPTSPAHCAAQQT